MRHDVLYLITFRPDVGAPFRDCDRDFAELLGGPHVWLNAEADRSAWMPADHEAKVKLLFLAWIRSEYGDGSPEIRDALDRETLDSEVFDRYWVLQRVAFGTTDTEMVERQVTATAIRPLSERNRPVVRAWLDSLKTRTGQTSS